VVVRPEGSRLDGRCLRVRATIERIRRELDALAVGGHDVEAIGDDKVIS
jgi:hypothetical protein